MKVYFDANIWIDHAWGFFNESKKVKKRITELFDKIESKNIDVVISTFVNAEISNHFKDWILMKKSIEDGFSYREFRSIRKKYKLEKVEIKKVDDVAKKILQLNWVTIVEKETLHEEDLKIFMELTSQYSIDSIDALHSIMAAKTNCRYLITNDETFIEQLNLALKENDLLNEFSAITSKNFINLK
ncbi:PIN domain-containing protein [Patescibacteria group bacterium]|nr:PIN domain-containing protein [Patescibacteria group bacterium]